MFSDEDFEEYDAVAVVELFAMNNNALVEKKSKEIIRNKLDIPVVCGNELFSDIDTLQRGASVLLNAGLIPTIDEFTKAIEKVLDEKNIHVPVGIVRSDGSLMSEKFAMDYPVEFSADQQQALLEALILLMRLTALWLIWVAPQLIWRLSLMACQPLLKME